MKVRFSSLKEEVKAIGVLFDHGERFVATSRTDYNLSKSQIKALRKKGVKFTICAVAV